MDSLKEDQRAITLQHEDQIIIDNFAACCSNQNNYSWVVDTNVPQEKSWQVRNGLQRGSSSAGCLREEVDCPGEEADMEEAQVKEDEDENDLLSLEEDFLREMTVFDLNRSDCSNRADNHHGDLSWWMNERDGAVLNLEQLECVQEQVCLYVT